MFDGGDGDDDFASDAKDSFPFASSNVASHAASDIDTNDDDNLFGSISIQKTPIIHGKWNSTSEFVDDLTTTKK